MIHSLVQEDHSNTANTLRNRKVQSRYSAGLLHVSKQIAQLTDEVQKMDVRNGKLPSQVEVNPKEQVNAVAFRNGKEIHEPTQDKEAEVAMPTTIDKSIATEKEEKVRKDVAPKQKKPEVVI